MDTNELDFHAWWTVNGGASFKTLSGTLWIVIRSGDGQSQREESPESGLLGVKRPRYATGVGGWRRGVCVWGEVGGMLRAPFAELGTPGPLKGFGKLFGISRVLEIQW